MISSYELEELRAKAAHYDELGAAGMDDWEGYFLPERHCVGCGHYYGWHIDECPTCFVDLPKPKK